MSDQPVRTRGARRRPLVAAAGVHDPPPRRRARSRTSTFRHARAAAADARGAGRDRAARGDRDRPVEPGDLDRPDPRRPRPRARRSRPARRRSSRSARSSAARCSRARPTAFLHWAGHAARQRRDRGDYDGLIDGLVADERAGVGADARDRRAARHPRAPARRSPRRRCTFATSPRREYRRGADAHARHPPDQELSTRPSSDWRPSSTRRRAGRWSRRCSPTSWSRCAAPTRSTERARRLRPTVAPSGSPRATARSCSTTTGRGHNDAALIGAAAGASSSASSGRCCCPATAR